MDKQFSIAGLGQQDGQWYVLGTYDGRFLQLPVSDEEREQIAPHLADGRTYGWDVDDERMEREAEVLITAAVPA